MKYRLIIAFNIIFALNCAYSFADEECDQSLKDAKALYNAGKYQEAKDLFVYIQQICSPTYGSANIWIQKCDQALNGGSKPTAPSSSRQPAAPATTLSASKTQVNASEGRLSEFISITSNKSWSISSYPSSWCQVSPSGSGITLTISDNPYSYSRSTKIQITTSDNQKNLTININQAAKPQTTTTSGTSDSSSATLSLSKTYIAASAAGTTEYITVTCNRNWEIQYPSATMYTVTKLSNTSIKVVINRNTGGSRQDFFNIKTTDNSKIVKVSISQGQGGSSSYYNNSSYRSTRSGYAALSDFNSYQGKWEVDWLGIRALIGTGVAAEMSMFAFRYSVLKIEPGIIGIRYDFINDYAGFYYQPDVKFIFPWNKYCAVEFGVGPSINVDLGASDRSYYSWHGHTYRTGGKKYPKAWFTTEFSILYHWSEVCSSDFFLRYDGMFTVGVSFNISTGF